MAGKADIVNGIADGLGFSEVVAPLPAGEDLGGVDAQMSGTNPDDGSIKYGTGGGGGGNAP
jgi:hypothetical protein